MCRSISLNVRLMPRDAQHKHIERRAAEELAPMYAAESYILRVFMTMTSSVVVLGLAFGLLTLPVLLALFGGDRERAAAAGG